MAVRRWFWRMWTGLGGAARGELTKADVWKGAAARLGATFLPSQGRRRERILHDHGPWRIEVELEVSSDGMATTVRTQARAPFAGHRELRLAARPRRLWHGWLEGVGAWRRLPLGPALLERYAVRGRPAGRVPSVFSPGLVDRLLAAPPTLLDVGPAPRTLRRRHGDRVGQVRARTDGVVVDEDALVALVRVAEEALEALRRIGEADGTPLTPGGSADGRTR